MGGVMRSTAGIALAAILLVAGPAAWIAGSAPARAQTLNDRLAGRAGQAAGQKEKLLVEAKELVYDNDKNTVAAVGNAELHYGPRTLTADRVLYDRNTSRVFAQGNVRLTEASGAVVTADRMELTDDFKTGFIDSLRLQQTIETKGHRPARARFSAPRAERIEGETTTFDYGTYTACEPCKDHPERPPLWQIKATRIIHDNAERRIYYEDSTLEVAGIPVAYLPYFYSPDPTVRKETGFLAPRIVSSTALGTGIGVPFFWNIAPDYDLTVTPTFLTRQGVLGQAEWRQRLDNGFYTVRATGIFQQDRSAFLPTPLGSGDRNFRGAIESKGQFNLAPQWRAGWDVVSVTDKWFLDNYRIRTDNVTTEYFREAVSTGFLIGQGDRSWFEARGYYFKGLSTFDWQKQQAVVGPEIDYDKRINGPGFLGGEVKFEGNFQHLSRDVTQYQGLPTSNYLYTSTYNGISYPLYSTCAVFQRDRCIVNGLAGTDTRATGQVSWRRTFTDDFGQVWQPFAYLRGDAIFSNPQLSGYQNPEVAKLFSPDSDFAGRVMPAVGLEYRYPFVADFGRFGTHTVEPIVQVIARPSETHIGRLPNEDAQSLVFDDTSLFDWDKFSGYDRVEGGVRANVGGQYSVTTANGFYANALFGESIQLAGVNSFRRGDIANVGRDSGLETRNSDFVGRILVAPNQNLSFVTRARFDQSTFALKRFETGVTANFAPFLPLQTSLLYARYEAQPELGYDHRREGIQVAATYNITPNYFVTGSALVDLSHYLDVREQYAAAYAAYAASPIGAAPVYNNPAKAYLAATSIGVGYRDECTTVSLQYAVAPIQTATGTRERNQTVLLRLELRTLGEANFRQNLTTSSTADGIASVTR
jgi:LPS-assembly protein